MMSNTYIPFHQPSIGEEEIEAVKQVLASKWLTTGPVTHEFEAEFAAYIGCTHAIAVSSATAALQLAMDVIGLRPGDEVLLPNYTLTATAEVLTYFGAVPVLVESTTQGFNMESADAVECITERRFA